MSKCQNSQDRNIISNKNIENHVQFEFFKLLKTQIKLLKSMKTPVI